LSAYHPTLRKVREGWGTRRDGWLVVENKGKATADPYGMTTKKEAAAKK
jgi:hypothetical protein